MSALDRKLLRDLMRLWPQALAIALVVASGVATLILGIGTRRSLDETRTAYYEQYEFADVFAELTRAPKPVARSLEEIAGVRSVELRIRRFALLDLEQREEPATGLAISLPEHRPAVLNRLYLRQGRLPDPSRAGEVTVNEPFAKANGLGIGSQFSAVLGGTKRTLTVVGVALSPEFVYALGPGDLMPDNRRFGVLWMSEKSLAGIFDLEGAFNAVELKLLPGTNEAEVIRQVDGILERYGGVGAYARVDQVSHAFLDGELKQLQAMSRVIPPIFLFVSAFLMNLTLSRLIALEREQIGLLKALGYSRLAVTGHYMRLVLLIAVFGIGLGSLAGNWLGRGLTRLYGDFFFFPFLVFSRDLDVYALAALVSCAAAFLGGAKALWEVLALAPAVAMQPPVPPRFRQTWIERLGLLRPFSQVTTIAVRHMLRWPLRALLTALGIALATGLVVVAFFTLDSVEMMIDITFFRTERQQATLNFAEEAPLRVLHDVEHMPGVLRAEPYRIVAVKLRNGHLERRLSIIGKPPERELSRVLDVELKPVDLPEHGLLVNQRLADVLELSRGDEVEVELLGKRRGIRRVVVDDVIESYFGLGAFMDIDALSRLVGEGPRVSGVHIAYDRRQQPALYRAVKNTPAIAAIELQRIALQRFRETMAENISIMRAVYITLSVIIAFGVVYNSTRIQLSERARELASLRVLGFTRGEVSRVLLTELAILTALAQPLGWLLGYVFGWALIRAFQSDLFTVPFVIEPATYGTSALVVLAAAAASALIVRQRVDRLDLIAVLKTRD
ncbi:MAG: FtsX-like permease family protein [Hyphomicrobiaceae bacterium]|nr:FtsX-like permease family protein [Hyphomicrobiaceae bacterium]